MKLRELVRLSILYDKFELIESLKYREYTVERTKRAN